MKFKIDASSTYPSDDLRISIMCPHCGNNGSFEKTQSNDVSTKSNMLGIRRCPNSNCYGHLFIVTNKSKELLFTSPSNTIPFNKDNIPAKVLSAFEEAVKCHANSCFIASAIMIRKTLEEVCEQREAKGANLFKKLEDLSSKILIPQELKDGMQELRLLGNDAAHIESQTFNDVGETEINISIEFTKEILKATYQYESLLTKLKSLKKDSANN